MSISLFIVRVLQLSGILGAISTSIRYWLLVGEMAQNALFSMTVIFVFHALLKWL